jgi:hypothetical protein
VRPAHVPLQIDPSTAAHEIAAGAGGMTQLAGSRAMTMAVKATSASTVIQRLRRTARSAHVQHDCSVHQAGRPGVLDGSRVDPNAVLL